MPKSANMKDQYAERYEIQLTFLREQKNVHQREAPVGAPFRVIGPRSPKAWRHEVEKLARYFKRELGFDFPPYTANEAESDSEPSLDRVLVVPKIDWEHTIYLIGAVGVRWSEWDDAPPCWSVTWAWLHPYERRKGHLTRVWPFLLRMFPGPHIEPPVSPSMMQFLRKVRYCTGSLDYEI